MQSIISDDVKHIRRNIIVFAIIGALFYGFSAIKYSMYNSGELPYNPLHYHGISGIGIGVTSGVFGYYCYSYTFQTISAIKLIFWSIVWFFIWVFSIPVIDSFGYSALNEVIKASWIGLLSIMFFMGVGAINGLFGFWICIINILIACYAIVMNEPFNSFVVF